MDDESLFEWMMKHNSKRWSNMAAIWYYNCLTYNKRVVSRDYNLASLLGAITIINLFSIQHKFVQFLALPL